jgi:hypothetical protein
MTAGRSRAVNAGVHHRLVRAFRDAADAGNVIVLEQMLAADALG